MDDIVVVENLVKYFGDSNGIKTEVLHNINVSFKRGAFTAIIGPSGSGKTTLLNIISLLESPSSGKLYINEKNFSTGNINDYSSFRNENIGFIFQFHYLLPEFTAIENILMPYWIGYGNPPASMVRKATKLMKEINILSVKDKLPRQMSGGQQQRVAIARALLNDPQIVFADEPTGNLDRETGFAVLEIMKRMVKEKGTTLIMVTHDREIAIKADRILELVDGKICKSLIVKEKGEKKIRRLLEDRECTF